MSIVYDVFTDADPAALTEIAGRVATAWILFALGNLELNGHTIAHPTGRLASAIRVEQRSPTQIAIIADESVAPEALWLEVGHGPIDLKTTLGGRHIPLHRGGVGEYGSAGYGSPVIAASSAAKSTWAAPRQQGLSGFRTVSRAGAASDPDAWVIPAMAAWSPAGQLADMISNGDFD